MATYEITILGGLRETIAADNFSVNNYGHLELEIGTDSELIALYAGGCWINIKKLLPDVLTDATRAAGLGG